SDSSVAVELYGRSGSRSYRLYDPRTNIWGDPQIVSGGAVRTFNKPTGAGDWVIYIGGTAQTWRKMDFDKDSDVDMSDFAHLQKCFSGDTFPYAAGCADGEL